LVCLFSLALFPSLSIAKCIDCHIPTAIVKKEEPKRVTTLQEIAVGNARKYIGTQEKTGNNDGPEVETFLRYVGLPKGNPYCVAFALYNYHIAAEKTKQPDVFPKLARASLLYKACQKNPFAYKVIPANRVFLGIENLALGDIAIWAHGEATGNFAGHGGTIERQIAKNEFDDIEGNTGPGAKGSQREGDGVYRRTRKLDIGKTFQVVGFIRYIKG
jgi:hypothetical protein